MRTRRSIPSGAPALRRSVTALVIGAVAVLGAACSDGADAGGSPARSHPETSSPAPGPGATSTPPDGSGATAPGLTATSVPPIVPSGASKANAACRQMYPVITDAVTAWNSAAGGDATAAGKAAEGLTKAANAVAPIAKDSGDSRLIQLTDAVSAQLKAVATNTAADKDVDGSALTKAQTDLWTYCRSAT